MLQFSKTCLLLVTFLLGFTFPAWPETYPDERPQVIVSVYNDAGVAATVLAEAERRAARIFARSRSGSGLGGLFATNHVGPDALVRARRAGGLGVDCRVRPARRHPFSTAPVLAGVRPARRANEVFGVAFLSVEGTGCYSDVFYDRALELHTDWKVGLADILGNVMAHELGHLLLGSNAHSPRRESCGHIGKVKSCAGCRAETCGSQSEQAEHMRGKLNGVRRRWLCRALKLTEFEVRSLRPLRSLRLKLLTAKTRRTRKELEPRVATSGSLGWRFHRRPEPSFNVWIASTGMFSKRSVSPLGQRIWIQSILATAPRPKWMRMSLFES